MFVTPTAITVLELVRAQNLELYIGSDEVTLMRFAEFKRHLMGKLVKGFWEGFVF